MGEVYKARDTRLDRMVAIKTLPQEFASDAARRRRFEQEARAVAALNHPNIVELFDVGDFWVVTELLEGEPLRAAIEKLSARRAVEIARQVAQGLAAAHSRGIAHRDLKPENIFLLRDGRVKLLDFGLAKPLPSAGADGHAMAMDLTMTVPGHVMGTVAYMSPEQIRSHPLDHRSDIFSFGVALYEMLTGERPFRGATSADIMGAVLGTEPPDLPASTPPALARIVHRCLEKGPERRFQSAADLAFALEALGVASTSAVSAGPHVKEPHSPTRRRLIYGAGAVALGGAGFAAAFLLRPASKQPPRFREIPTPLGQPVKDGGAIHPDGRSLVYLNKNVGGLRIIHHDLESGLTRDLGLPSGSAPVSISVSGELAFLRNHILYRTPLANPAPRGVMENVFHAAWSSDGRALMVLRTVGGKHRIEFPIGSVLYETSNRISLVCLSRTHNRVAFIERTPERGFELTALESPGRKRIFFSLGKGRGLYNYGNPFWSVDEREVWASPFEGGDHSAIEAYDDAGRRRVVVRLPGWVHPLGISDAGTVLLTVVSEESRVRIAEPGSGKEKDIPMDARVHAISPDGGAFVLARWKDAVDHSDLYLYQAGASAPALIGTGFPYSVSFSSDGKWVHAYRESGSVLIPTGPGEERRLVVPDLKAPVALALLPDGKRMLVQDYRVDKTLYLWENGSAPIPMRFEDPVPDLLLVSPDGQRFIYSNSRQWRMCLIESGTPATLPGIDAQEKVFGWTADSAGLFVGKVGAPDLAIYRYHLSSGTRSRWKTLSSNRSDTVPMDVWIAPDGGAYGYSLFRSTARLIMAEGVG
jgi:serine/threonine protein kinase